MPAFGMRFRQRQPPPPHTVPLVTGILDVIINGVPYPNWPGIVNPVHCNVTPYDAMIERTWDSNNPGPPYHASGPFTNVKIRLGDNVVLGQGAYTSRPDYSFAGPAGSFYRYRYSGGFAEPQFIGDFTTHTEYETVGMLNGGGHNAVNPQDLSGLGPEAFNRLRPKYEHAGAAQFLAELRDVPRMLKTTSKLFHESWKAMGGHGSSAIMKPKSVSDQFINHEFGWLPFLKDLSDFHKVYRDSQKFVKRHMEHNDKWERRYTVLSNTESREVLASGGGWGVSPGGDFIQSMFAMNSTGGSVAPTYSTVLEKYQHIWASGLFKAYRPEFDPNLPGYNSGWNSMQQQLLLYGVRLNPTVLYKITPWTWLIDWFSNVGANIDNANAIAVDSVASKNLFLMSHSTSRITFEQVAPFWDGTRTMKWARLVELKQRGIGGPFGLGWSKDALSLRQLAILAALGITHSP